MVMSSISPETTSELIILESFRRGLVRQKCCLTEFLSPSLLDWLIYLLQRSTGWIWMRQHYNSNAINVTLSIDVTCSFITFKLLGYWMKRRRKKKKSSADLKLLEFLVRYLLQCYVVRFFKPVDQYSSRTCTFRNPKTKIMKKKRKEKKKNSFCNEEWMYEIEAVPNGCLWIIRLFRFKVFSFLQSPSKVLPKSFLEFFLGFFDDFSGIFLGGFKLKLSKDCFDSSTIPWGVLKGSSVIFFFDLATLIEILKTMSVLKLRRNVIFAN